MKYEWNRKTRPNNNQLITYYEHVSYLLKLLEWRPVQEIVYQLTDTEHLDYTPFLQTSSITCRNNSQETVNVI